jgi:hypothetical protein
MSKCLTEKIIKMEKWPAAYRSRSLINECYVNARICIFPKSYK